MKLQNINIKDIGGIHELSLNGLHPHVNVISGPNGVGKTTVLKAIAALLSCTESLMIKRNAQSLKGSIEGTLSKNKEAQESKILEIVPFAPNDSNTTFGFNEGLYVIYISDKRELEYTALNSIPRDIKLSDWNYNNVLKAFNPDEIKGWFANRFLFSTAEEGLPPHQILNYELAKNAFSVLDQTVSFKRVDSSSFDIMLETPAGEIYMEYLSSGYKSLIILLLGIIKEIEFRFNAEKLAAKDFEGVILIDEIDLHLHPTWQTEIIKALTELFPNAQFFISTHSPHVIQNLNPRQLLVLEKKEGGIQLRDLPQSEFGFKGWSVEEILRDIMGMESTETEFFQKLWRDFAQAIQNDNAIEAHKAAGELLTVLHPQNELRKIIELQLSGLPND